ncbi:protein-L-isoaspartate O-methyltransferase [Cryptococcus depauperatus CBS 7841]|uniref:Protein-L-isoaspartate O-methyltransferase n=1 Tax=Cryptococcus depauperatus CBS 7841 TaxID=1295531 RepID=A0AAJ8JQX1_9TREE
MSSQPMISEPPTEQSPLVKVDKSRCSANETEEHHNIAGLSAVRFRLVCGSLWCACFLVAFDSTLVSTLLSDIGSAFHASTQVSWLGTAYLLSVCCFTPIYGRLSDLIGRRNAHLIGLALFTTGTFACAIAPTMYSLIAARFLAGAGGGGVASVSTILLTDLVDLRYRGIFQGYANLLYGLGAALGGPVGGWISDRLGWRAAFYMQVPLLALSIFLIYTFVVIPQPESLLLPPQTYARGEHSRKSQSWRAKLARIDYLGSATLALAVVSLLLSMSIKTSATKPSGGDYTFSDPLIWGLLVSSAIFTTIFLLVEEYYSLEPILPLKLLTHRTPMAIAISSFTMVTVQFSVLYNIPLFFSIVQQKSSSITGAHLLPNSILIGAGSLFVGWVMRRTGKYWWIGVDCALLIMGTSVAMCFWNQHSPDWLTWVAQAPGGFGYAGVLTTSLVALMTHVQRADEGEMAVATSMTYLFRTMGQVLGVAISSAIVQTVVLRDLVENITGPEAVQIIDLIRHSTSSIHTLPKAYQAPAIQAYDHALGSVTRRSYDISSQLLYIIRPQQQVFIKPLKMAWLSSGRSNTELIENMIKSGLIHSPRVAAAMKKVDRKNYVRDESAAYEDSPQSIGFGATISAPHMHAHACEDVIDLLPDDKTGQETSRILDVGSGSGYLTAVFHRLSPASRVIGIDHIPGLVQQSIHNLSKDGIQVVGEHTKDGGGVVMVCGDGRKGSIEHAPFRVIHVGAAAPELPQDLVDQLAKPGRMFIPVGEGSQDVWQIDKSATGQVTKKKLFGVRYVPLTDRHKQWRT